MANILALFLQLTPVDSCLVPEVGVEITMRVDDTDVCVATVRYLPPECEAYYSATELVNGFSLEGNGPLTPAMQFIRGGVQEDGWVLLEEAVLEIETDFASTQFVRVDPNSCSCQ